MPQRTYLRTTEVARAVGVHPNTVRLYEQLGFLPPVPRTQSGYRQFTPIHIEQMRLARLGMGCTWLGGEIRQHALDMLYAGAKGNLQSALEKGQALLQLIQAERAQAEAAADFLQHWAQGAVVEKLEQPLQIGEAARLLNSTVDSLRNWERNGLIRVPRHSHSGYRLYGAAEIGRLRVIRMLLYSGYSTMAVLRMMIQFDQGRRDDLRSALDIPRADEDMITASDRWLSTLREVESKAQQAIELLEQRLERDG